MGEDINITGLNAAILTPFTISGGIDFVVLKEHAKRLINADVRGFVIGGTTGEGMHLSAYEALQVAESLSILREANRYSFNIIGGVIKNDERKSIEQVRLFEQANGSGEIATDALLVATPVGSNFDDGQTMNFYSRIADMTSIPIVVYNIPSRTGYTVSGSVLLDMYHKTRGRVIGVKNSAGDVSLAVELIKLMKDGREMPLHYMQGNARYHADAWGILRTGGYEMKPASISGAANHLPFARIEGAILTAVADDDYERASELQKFLNKIGFEVLSFNKDLSEPAVLKGLVRAGGIHDYPLIVRMGMELGYDEYRNVIAPTANTLNDVSRELLRSRSIPLCAPALNG